MPVFPQVKWGWLTGAEQADPIDRMIRTVSRVMLVGMGGLALMALGQAGWAAGLRLFLVGLLAAITAAGVGAIVGLIFGIPETTGRVIVSASDAAEGKAAARDTTDWFSDNSALERIAVWLTGAIIALTLVNFDNWVGRYNHAAAIVTEEMLDSPADRGREFDARLATASTQLRARERARDDAATELQEARRAEPSPPATTRVNQSAARLKAAERDVAEARAARNSARAAWRSDRPIALGGLILAAYGLLGFVGSYFWTRRYLPAELARARLEQRNVMRADEAAARELQARSALGGTVAPAPIADAAAAAQRAVAALQAGTAVAAAAQQAQAAKLAPPTVANVINPGNSPDDPWKGAFGGSSIVNGVSLSAKILPHPIQRNRFLVDLMLVAGQPAAGTPALAGKLVRVYFHPSIPDPIREYTVDARGELRLALDVWGGFTVGFQRLDNADLLELDLATLPDAPASFRVR